MLIFLEPCLLFGTREYQPEMIRMILDQALRHHGIPASLIEDYSDYNPWELPKLPDY